MKDNKSREVALEYMQHSLNRKQKKQNNFLSFNVAKSIQNKSKMEKPQKLSRSRQKKKNRKRSTNKREKKNVQKRRQKICKCQQLSQSPQLSETKTLNTTDHTTTKQPFTTSGNTSFLYTMGRFNSIKLKDNQLINVFPFSDTNSTNSTIASISPGICNEKCKDCLFQCLCSQKQKAKKEQSYIPDSVPLLKKTEELVPPTKNSPKQYKSYELLKQQNSLQSDQDSEEWQQQQSQGEDQGQEE